MSLPHVSPAEARRLIARGALLVDIRDIGEHARERIPQASNRPLSQLCEGAVGEGHAAIVFHCKSGARTRLNAPLLARAATAEAYILDGGIEAWKQAGFPIEAARREPMALARQALILRGGLALAGAGLGFFAAPAFHLIPAAIGAEILIAGLTGASVVAGFLKAMPWNRSPA